jgi:hypothetical protein
MRLWKSITHVVSQKDLLSARLAKFFDHGANMRNGLCRRAQERDQTLPGILPNQSQTSIFLNGFVDDRIPINLLQNGI